MKASVKDAMTTQVVAVKLGASFKEMAARLRQSRVSAFPVTDDDGKVIGVVSEADMLARQVLSTGMLHRGEQDRPEGLTADDLMSHPAITVSPGDSVEVAEIRKQVADDVIGQESGAAPRQFVIVRKVRHVQGVVAVRDRLSYPDLYASIAGPGF